MVLNEFNPVLTYEYDVVLLGDNKKNTNNNTDM